MKTLFHILGMSKWKEVDKEYISLEKTYFFFGKPNGSYREDGLLVIEQDEYSGEKRASFITPLAQTEINPIFAQYQIDVFRKDATK